MRIHFGSHGPVPHERASHGAYLMVMHLMCVYLTGIQLMGMHGKKVFLSLGGAASDFDISGDGAAEELLRLCGICSLV